MATDSVASIIADILKKDLKPNKPIIEINPGPGLLTKHLINETENTLMLYEPNEAFYSELSVSKRFSYFAMYYDKLNVV